jgi:MtN3 and saliva related transmembrane protein
MLVAYNVIGWIANICSAINILPQLMQAILINSTRGLNSLTVAAIIIGNIFWIIYGILINSYPIIISSILQMSIAIILVGLKYRKVSQK